MGASSDPQPQGLLLALLQLLPLTHQTALTSPELSPPTHHNQVLQLSDVARDEQSLVEYVDGSRQTHKITQQTFQNSPQSETIRVLNKQAQASHKKLDNCHFYSSNK